MNPSIDVYQLYKDFECLDNVDESLAGNGPTDPEISLLLRIMDNYAVKFTDQIYQQERQLNCKLIQNLAELLFRPLPFVAVMEFSGSVGDYLPRYVSGDDNFINNSRKEIPIRVHSENNISWKPLSTCIDKNSQQMTVEFLLKERLQVRDIYKELTSVGISCYIAGNQLNANKALALFGDIYLESVVLECYEGGVPNKIYTNNLKISLGLDMDIFTNKSMYDVTPEILYEAISFPEIQRGFRLYISNNTVNCTSNTYFDRIKVVFKFSVPIDLMDNVKFVWLPLIISGICTKELVPKKMSGNSELTLDYIDSGSEFQSIYSLQSLSLICSKKETSTQQTNFRDEIEKSLNINVTEGSQHYRYKTNKLVRSKVILRENIKNTLLIGMVEVATITELATSDYELLAKYKPIQESGSSSFFHVCIQSIGRKEMFPDQLLLEDLLVVCNRNNLLTNPRLYINSAINCAVVSLISQGELAVNRISCDSVKMVESNTLQSGKPENCLYLIINLNTSLEYYNNLVVVALGLCKQLKMAWAPMLNFRISVADCDGRTIIVI